MVVALKRPKNLRDTLTKRAVQALWNWDWLL